MKFRDVFWTQKQPWRGLRSYCVPRLFRFVHLILVRTLRISHSGLYQMSPYLHEKKGGLLMVLWHDHTLVPLHYFANLGIGSMMSHSRAGQLQAALWRLYGWPIVWGSTKKKEGIAALRTVLAQIKAGGIFGFTPDGPKGPRRQAHGGAIYLASKSGVPIIPLGVAASRAWYLPTWDKYLIPKPFARFHIHLGEPLHVPANLSREDSEEWRVRLKIELDKCEAIAMRALE